MRDRQWVRQNGAAISHDRSGPARAKPGVQRKLVVGPADDAFEREADVVAAKVIAGLYSGAIDRGGGALQRSAQPGSAVGAEGGEVSGATASRIRPSRNDRLDAATRTRMEEAFGADFSEVRVHTSATVDVAAEGLQADAFTLGRDVYVRRELFRPGTRDGDHLLAHELTHTIQQGGSRIRRSSSPVGHVSWGMAAGRVSMKKRLLYLDFVKMKRYDPKYGKAIKQALGMDVTDDSAGGTWGHWWTEVGKRNPITGEWKPKKSYGWWPEHGAGGVTGALAGVDGKLNKDGSDHDPHEGDEGEKGLSEFHPAMNLDTGAETYDEIKDRVTKDIDTFARGYAGKWQWKLGWGQNCHTFQQAMKSRVKMHYQTAKDWLEDPTARAKIAAKAKAAQEKTDADAREKSANLALVATAKKWYVWTEGKSISTLLPPDGDDGPSLPLDDSKEFAPTGKARKLGFYYAQEVVTRNGGRGWVSEMELKSFSNMGG